MGQGKAIFLDRDGTIIYDAGYPKDPEELQLMPGVLDALAFLRKKGFKLIIVSNQSGIGRGILTYEDVNRINDHLVSILRSKGITIDGIYYCPHAPDEGCICRKPSPYMLKRGAIDHGVDLLESFMIGDKKSDIEAGKAAGCRTIFIGNTLKDIDGDITPDFFVRNWYEALSLFDK